MKSPRPTVIALVVALVAALALPAASGASRGGSASTDRAVAQERCYGTFANSEPLPAPSSQPARVTIEDAGAWKPLAIGAGALVLVLIAAEMFTLVRLRSVGTA